METADACSDDDADAVLVDSSFGRFLELGVGHGLTGCHEGVLCVEVELTGLATVEVVFGIEAFDLTGELRLEEACVEVCDRSGAADTGYGVVPRGLNVVAERGDGTHAGNYYSFKFHL